MRNKIPIYKKYTKEELKSKVASATSFSGFAFSLGYKSVTGTLFKILKPYLDELKIDYSHLLKRSNKRILKEFSKKEILLKLNTRGKIAGSSLKKWIKKFNLSVFSGRESECGICGLQNSWNSSPLILQLDHIDGDNENNQLNNLRFICPNCHSQTDTFCGRGTNWNKDNFCIDCFNKIGTKSIRCQTCNTNWIKKFQKPRPLKFSPSKDELTKLVIIDKIPFTTLGKKYGVSDNAVRARCKKLDIPLK